MTNSLPDDQTRILEPKDLGIQNDQIDKLKGTITSSANRVTVRIELIEGRIGAGRVFAILRQLRQMARKNGAKELVIECSIANEKVLNIAQSRYNAESSQGMERITQHYSEEEDKWYTQ